MRSYAGLTLLVIDDVGYSHSDQPPEGATTIVDRPALQQYTDS